jgi:hypothetical protein
MDIVEYQKARDAEIAHFQESYNDLKAKYETLLSDAVYETDPQKKDALVKQLLDTNAALSAEVREFIKQSNQKEGYDPKVIEAINNDLITYQNQYNEIKSANDKQITLQSILNEKQNILTTLQSKYKWLIGGLIFTILILLILIFSTPYSGMFSTISTTLKSVPQELQS